MALIAPASAGADGVELEFRGCVQGANTLPALNGTGREAQCTKVPNLWLGGDDLAMSPSGGSVYTTAQTSWPNPALVAFTRNSASGALTYRTCLTTPNPDPGDPNDSTCPTHGHAPTSTLAVAPGSQWLYSTTSGNARGFRTSGDNLVSQYNLGTPAAANTEIAISPNGRSIYTVSSTRDYVAWLHRDPDTGSIAPGGCIADVHDPSRNVPWDCEQKVPGLAGAMDVAVSSDGKWVFVASAVDDTLLRFARDQHGNLTLAECVADAPSSSCAKTVPNLDGPAAVAVSPNSDSVYVGARNDDVVWHFSVGQSGTLTPNGCVGRDQGSGCGETTGHPLHLQAPTDIAVHPAGHSVYITDERDLLIRLARSGDGEVEWGGCIGDEDGYANHPGHGWHHQCQRGGLSSPALLAPALGSAAKVAVSPDGAFVYVGTPSQGHFNFESGDEGISWFRVERTPPETTVISGPPNGAKLTAPARYQLHSSDGPDSSFECEIDNEWLDLPLGWLPCEAAPEIGTYDGPHTVRFRAVDSAGNIDPTPVTRTFSLDRTAPQTTITSPAADGETLPAAARFRFESSEPGSTFECRIKPPGLDPTPWVTCQSGTGSISLPTASGYRFEVRATDDHGNTDPSPAARIFDVDANPPETEITSPPEDGFVGGREQIFEFHSPGTPDATFECRALPTQLPAFRPCESPNLRIYSDGANRRFEVRAVDSAGNVDPTPAVRAFTVDTEAPETTITSGPAEGSTITDPAPAFSFESSEPGSEFKCSVDGSRFSACESPNTLGGIFGGLADGAHTFKVYATDAAGNKDESPATRTFTIDTDAPDALITAGPENGSYINDRTPTFEFTSSDPLATFECNLRINLGRPGDWVPCSSPHTGPLELIPSRYTFAVRAKDPVGLTGAPDTREFTIDVTAPDTIITAGPAEDSRTADPSPLIGFTSPDPDATFACSLDGAPGASCTSPLELGVPDELSDGEHTVTIVATDEAGNTDPTPASRTFTVDTTPPQTTITAGPAGGALITDRTPEFEFSADEPGATFECSLDSGTPDFGPCSGPGAAHTAHELADGEWTFRVRASDDVGNVDASPAERTFSVDATAPDTQITAGPEGLIRERSPRFEFGASETGVTYECSLDSGTPDFGPCSGPGASHTPGSDLGDGDYTFRVRATDEAGNSDSSPATRSFEVDATPPDTTIDSGPSGTTPNPRPTFEFSSDDDGATFECELDGEPLACSSPLEVAAEPGPPLSDGPHSLRVTAIDAAGNADPSPAERNFTVEAPVEPPDTTITSGPSGPTADATPQFGFTSDDDGATFECRLDDRPFVPCWSPHDATAQDGGPLADGPHTFEVRALAGTTADETPASREFTVDATPPQTTITSGPAQDETIDHPNPRFGFSSDDPTATFECRFDDADWGACTAAANHIATTPLENGAHSFEVRATDALGNTDTTPARRDFTVDVVKPIAEKERDCQNLDATILGTDGDDVLVGTAGRDIISGGGGRDVIKGLGGNDSLCGYSDNDKVLGQGGDDYVRGGRDNDTVDGGGGRDLVLGWFGNDKIFGRGGPDVLRGGQGNDRMDGGPGKDRLFGNAGNDALKGGGGRDFCSGRGGRNTFRSCEKAR